MKKYQKRKKGWRSEGKHFKREKNSIELQNYIEREFGIRVKFRPTA